MSRHILSEIEYLIEHRNDYLSDQAVVENIAKALNGQRFSPPTFKELSDYRMNTKVPQHLYDDQIAALTVALGSDGELGDVTRQIYEVAAVATEPINGYWSLNTGAHASLEATLRAFGPAALGIVLRFHIEAGTSFSGPSEIRSHYFEDAAPEDPELDARIAAGVKAWKTALINKTI